MKEGVRMKKACFGGIMALMVILFVGCGKEEEVTYRTHGG